MLNTRYEEYSEKAEKLPFYAQYDIARDTENLSEEENWHENIEIEYVEEGCGFVIIDGERMQIEKGDFIIVNSNAIHYTGTEQSLKYSCIIPSSHFCNENEIDYFSLKFPPKIRDGALTELFLNLRSFYFSNDNFRVAKCRLALLKILIYICENHTLLKESANGCGKTEIIKNAIKYIRENYRERITLDEIARKCLVSKYTLSREFKRLTGKTVVEHINRYRVMRAKEMIFSGEKISSSATLSGFNNMSFFTRTFKKQTGMLPSELKRIK